MTVSLIFGGIAVLYTGLFAFGVWRRAGLRSRAELLTSAADCGFVLVLAHRLIDWGSVPAWAFLLPVALTAAGQRAGPIVPSEIPNKINTNVTATMPAVHQFGARISCRFSGRASGVCGSSTKTGMAAVEMAKEIQLAETSLDFRAHM